MRKSLTLKVPETEAANLEAALDELLGELRKLDPQADPTWERINRLKAETRAILDHVKARLDSVS